MAQAATQAAQDMMVKTVNMPQGKVAQKMGFLNRIKDLVMRLIKFVSNG